MNGSVSLKVVVVAVVVLCLMVAAWAVGSSRGASSTAVSPEGSRYGQEGLRVSGTAVVRAAPDLATVTLGYESRARRAHQAKVLNDNVMRKVISAVKAHGVESKDIQTTEYRLFPVWENDPPTTSSLFWHVLNMVQVRVRDVDSVADVIDAAAEAGADKIENVNYSVESLHELRAQAREKAADVAREKAQQLARLMGVRLGRVVAITDGNFQYYHPWSYGGANAYANAQVTIDRNAASAPSGQAESEISKGQIAVEAREDVVFALE